MAGTFELFTDGQSHVRFRFLAPNGTVLALSQAFGDKKAAAATITDVRECAGTGDPGPLHRPRTAHTRVNLSRRPKQLNVR